MPIAIVGFACRFPRASDAGEFWSLLRSGGYAIADLPPNRLDRDLYYSPDRGRIGKSYCTIGGIVDPVANDPELAAVGPELLDGADEAHRHLAAVVLAACREAGLPLHSEKLRRAGVYLAHLRGSALAAGLTYARSVEAFGESLHQSETFRRLHVSTADCILRQVIDEVRRSYPPLWQGDRCQGDPALLHPTAALKLLRTLTGCAGPAVNVDAACASSFQALDLAVRAIRGGEVEAAVVASASYNNWHSLVLFSQAQAVSDKGSFPFDRRADGFVSSDGYAAVVLKPLPAAERDRDPIHGVIRGIGISCDGAGRSLWAPRCEGQVAAIRRAWAGGPDPAQLQYIEAHGTATQLGDATEMDALNQALGRELAGRRIPISSVKANIGHSRESAGLAGLIKCLLAMRHRAIPPAVHFETPNPEIPWDRIPFYVPGRLSEWTEPRDGCPRIAAIDSFGIGGLNAHVVLEEYVRLAAGQVGQAVPPAEPAKVEGIAIVGVGCVLPGANSFDEFRCLVRSGADARRPVPDGRWRCLDRTPRPLGGFVDFEYDWRRHKIPPKTLETADPLQFMILEAADQAWLSAGFDADHRGGERAAVVVGTVFSGEFRNQLNLGLHLPDFKARLTRIAAQAGLDGGEHTRLAEDFERIFLEQNPALHDETGSFTSSTLASRLARTFHLMGGAFAVDAGECSSLAALSGAAQMLRAGDCDLAVCAAGQRSMDLISFEFAERYDAQWPLGEGSVALLLKRVADARADGNRIYGVIGEIGAEQTTAPAPHDPIVHKLGHTFAAAGLVSLLKHIALESDGQIRISGDAGLTWSAAVQCAPRIGRLMTPPMRPPRVAFLFGGQGAHYPGMLRSLIELNAAAAQALDECNTAFRDLGVPSFADFAWSPEARLGSDVRDTQLAALAADYVLFRAVRSMGVKPDVIAGYSFGDYAALVASGSLTLRDAVAIALERCRLLDRVHGELVAVRVSRQAFEAAACPGIHLAIHSSPAQLVVGGAADAIREFTRQAGSRGWDPLPVAVPRPYHTPLVRPISAEFRGVLEGYRLRPPMVPYLSTVDARYLADPDDLRASLVRHLSEPVRYDESIRRLAAEEPTIFVEIGPKQPLTQFHRRILVEQATGLIHTDSPSRPIQQLEKVRDLVQPRGPVRTATPAYFDATEKRRLQTAARPVVADAPEPRDEVEEFLVRFICERTGYPIEMVDMDADLEAGLGIDSIKRAELLGEAREAYHLDVRSGEKLSLRDFSTLRSIHTFIAERRRSEPVVSVAREFSPGAARYVLRLHAAPADESKVAQPGLVCVIGNQEKVEAVAAVLRALGAECSTCAPAGGALDQYFHARQWLARVRETRTEKQAAIVALTSLGGDFGFAGNIEDIESAGHAGFLKAVHREFPAVRVKVIDTAPGDDPTPYVIEELSSGDDGAEVAYRAGARYVIQAEAHALPSRDRALPSHDSALPSRDREGAVFHNAGAWVVTGGARGITARCADELASRLGIRLHILGRSPAAAVTTHYPYYQCDVTDRDGLARVLAEIRSQQPIAGILHGAGVEYSAGFLQKQAAHVRDTFEVKVQGALNLIELTADDPLQYFVAFGSAAGRFGGAGQTDYAMASELLAKITRKLRRDRPACKAVTFDWPAWDEVGMAVRPQTRIMLEMANRRFMPIAEGVAHLIAELEAGVPEGEVLILDGQASRDLDHNVREPAVSVSRTLDAANDFFLRDHRYRSEPLLPAAASLQLMLQAIGAATGSVFPRVRDFVVSGPLRFAESETKQVKVEAVRSADGFACSLLLPETGRVLAEALVADIGQPPRVDLPALPNLPCDVPDSAWKPYRYRTACESAAARTLFYGESMRCLKEVAGDAVSLYARILAASRPGDWMIDPALLDACLVACGSWAVHRFGVRPLAHGFGRLDIGRRPKAREACTLAAKFLGREGELLRFDFNLTGSGGDVIYAAERCSLTVAGERADD